MIAQPSITPSTEQQTAQQKLVLEGRARNGANWFFWIAGLSILNTIIYMAGGTISFIIGLGATQFVDGVIAAMIEEYGPPSTTILRLLAFGIDIGLAGIFIVAGLLSRRKHRWAMIAGMSIYLLDAFIFILVADWLGLIFHALALFGLWGGIKAMNALKKLETTQTIAIPTAPLTQELTWYRSDVLRILGGSCGVYVAILVILAIIGVVLTR